MTLTMTQNLWDPAKTVLREKFIAIQSHPKKQDALKWAAYTYVVAALGSLATLLYYIGLARRD